MNDKKYIADKTFLLRVIMAMKSSDDLYNIKQCCEMILNTIEKLYENHKDDKNIDGGKL